MKTFKIYSNFIKNISAQLILFDPDAKATGFHYKVLCGACWPDYEHTAPADLFTSCLLYTSDAADE